MSSRCVQCNHSVLLTCSHCKLGFCSRHIQCESHECISLKTKEQIKLPEAVKAPKVPPI